MNTLMLFWDRKCISSFLLRFGDVENESTTYFIQEVSFQGPDAIGPNSYDFDTNVFLPRNKFFKL